MPSGQTHDRITLWSFPFVIVVSLMRTQDIGLTSLIVSGFLFGAYMLGPDLDTRSIHFKRWGVMRWIWIPYRGSLKHRSPLSHWPLIGTSLRVIYVLAWAFVLCLGTMALTNEMFQIGWTWNDLFSTIMRSLHHHQAAWIAFGVGLELGALSHYMADWGVSTTKRVRRHFPKEGLWAFRRIVNPSPKKLSKKKAVQKKAVQKRQKRSSQQSLQQKRRS